MGTPESITAESERVGVNKVYVPQEALRKNEQNILVPKFNLNPAREFGIVTYLLTPSANPLIEDPSPIIRELRKNLEHFTDDDFILAIGNPMLIGWAVALAADANNGKVSMLQWNGGDRKYMRVNARLWEVQYEG